MDLDIPEQGSNVENAEDDEPCRNNNIKLGTSLEFAGHWVRFHWQTPFLTLDPHAKPNDRDIACTLPMVRR